MKKINPLFISGCLLLVAPAMSATLSGTLAPTVVPLTNGGQANIAVSNTDRICSQYLEIASRR